MIVHIIKYNFIPKSSRAQSVLISLVTIVFISLVTQILICLVTRVLISLVNKRDVVLFYNLELIVIIF